MGTAGKVEADTEAWAMDHVMVWDVPPSIEWLAAIVWSSCIHWFPVRVASAPPLAPVASNDAGYIGIDEGRATALADGVAAHSDAASAVAPPHPRT